MVDSYPDDDLSGSVFPSPEQKSRRRDEIQVWLDDFVAYCQANGTGDATYDPASIDILNDAYWETMGENVRPRIVPSHPDEPLRADRHKIASLMELMFNHHQPIEHPDARIRSDLNVRLAYTVAMTIIGNWTEEKIDDLFVSSSFDREHRTWLRQLNTHSEGYPIFSNAATWYLVEKIYLERHDQRVWFNDTVKRFSGL